MEYFHPIWNPCGFHGIFSFHMECGGRVKYWMQCPTPSTPTTCLSATSTSSRHEHERTPRTTKTTPKHNNDQNNSQNNPCEHECRQPTPPQPSVPLASAIRTSTEYKCEPRPTPGKPVPPFLITPSCIMYHNYYYYSPCTLLKCLFHVE